MLSTCARRINENRNSRVLMEYTLISSKLEI